MLFPDPIPVVSLQHPIFPSILARLRIRSGQAKLAVEDSLSNDAMVFFTTRPADPSEEPGPKGLHGIGTSAQIMLMLKEPDGSLEVLAQGLARARLKHLTQTEPLLRGRVVEIGEADEPQDDRKAEALVRSMKEALETAIDLDRSIDPVVTAIAAKLNHPGRLADLAASALGLTRVQEQKVLATIQPTERLRLVHEPLTQKNNRLDLERTLGHFVTLEAHIFPSDPAYWRFRLHEHRSNEASKAHAIYENWYSWAIRSRLGASHERPPRRSQAATRPLPPPDSR